MTVLEVGPPNGRPSAPLRRPILIVCCVDTLIIAAAGQMLPAMLGPIAREFEQNLAQRGILLMLAPLGFVISTLVSGYLSDRWGQRLFILTGFALLTAGLVLAAWAPTYLILQAGLFICGASFGFIESPIAVVGADAFPDWRAQALNVIQVFFNVGAIIGPAIIGALFWRGWNWRAGFGLCIVLSLAALVLSSRGLPRRRANVPAGHEQGERQGVRWWLVALIAITLFLYVGSEMTVGQWSANYVEQTFGVAPARAAIVVSVFWFGMMLGRSLYIVLVARMGYLLPVIWSAVLAAASAVAAACASSGLQAGIWCALTGFFLGGTWPTILAYAAHKSPGRIGTVFGAVVSAGALGGVFMPPLAGWVAQGTRHELRAAMLLGAAIIILEGLIVFGIWLWDRRPEAT